LIQYLKHKEIDKVKWDSALLACPNRIPYAGSWYLDLVSHEWDALVEDDFRFFMPVPINKKFGLTYSPQPAYTQQLGIFGKEFIGESKISQFISALPKSIRIADFSMNASNHFTEKPEAILYRTNLELLLGQPYDQLKTVYSENTSRNISKAKKKGLTVRQTLDPEAILRIKWENKPARMLKSQLELAGKIIKAALSREQGEIWEVMNPGKEVVGAAFFLRDDQRMIYLISASGAEGKEQSAMFLLVDECIRRHASLPLILDFEGSEIPGIARFFTGFGAVNHPYPKVRINRLPSLIRKFLS
jgi:hypothetical protein